MRAEEQVEKHGVFIVRFVESIDETVAVQVALEDFHHSEKGKALNESLLNKPNDPPVFEAEEVTELECIDPTEEPIGLIFYPEDADES